MKSSLKFVSKDISVAESFETLGLGKVWRGGEHIRFYINDSMLDFAHNELGFSFDFAYSELFIDLKSGEYKTSREISDNELIEFENLFNKIGKLLKENFGKKLYSSWTGQTQDCNDVYHFIGDVDNKYFN